MDEKMSERVRIWVWIAFIVGVVLDTVANHQEPMPVRILLTVLVIAIESSALTLSLLKMDGRSVFAWTIFFATDLNKLISILSINLR